MTAMSTAGSGQDSSDCTESGECVCGYSGSVEVVIDDNKIGHWTCPACGQESEMDWLFEPDPDDAYDRMRDERDGYY